jgi:hypothetical protein
LPDMTYKSAFQTAESLRAETPGIERPVAKRHTKRRVLVAGCGCHAHSNCFTCTLDPDKCVWHVSKDSKNDAPITKEIELSIRSL